MQQSLRSGPRPYSSPPVGRGAAGARLWRLALLLGLLLSSQLGWAQVVRTLPGDYASFGAAFADLNTNGVPAGGVTINVAAGYAETPTAPLLLTATGTAANPIVFQKSGTGANPKISAGVGTSTSLDAIIGLAGADYVTFDGLELAENAANTTATTKAEFGFALFRPSPTDGCQFNSIRNCVITLDKTNTATFGIYGAASTAAAATSVAATAPSGANSGNKVNGNIITNSATGLYFTASTLTTLANYDQNNEIGVTAGNQVYNFGTTATGWGIGANYQNGFRALNNVVNNTLNYAGGTTVPVAASTVTSTLRGIYGNTAPSASIDIVNNTITLASGTTTSVITGIENGIGSTAAANTVNITGNTVTIGSATATTSTLTGITNTASAATVNITGNTLTNCAFPAATTAAFTGISNTGAATTANLSTNTVTNNTTTGTGTMILVSGGSPTTLAMNGNTLTGNAKTGAGTTSSITLQCLTASTATITASNNVVSNNTITTSGTSTSTGTLYGYVNSSSPTAETLNSNTFTNLSIGGTSTSTASVISAIRTNTLSTDVQTITLNTIGGLAITGSGSGTVNGLQFLLGGGSGSSIARNKIYDLSAAGAAGVVNGITISGGGTYPLVNNLIGDLRAPAASGLVAVNGLNISSGTAVNAYFNTLYLSASSTAATFGTSGIYLNSTTTTLDARNNIVVNKSTAAGTGGYTVALRRSSGTAGTAPANLASTTNNNLYYAGAPSAANLIYVEGSATATNPQQTLVAYKAFVAARESNSVTEDVPFQSTTGSAATFLHIATGTPTQVESGGTPITGITTDYDGDPRNGTTPDLGADEGSFTPQDLSGPTIVYAALGSTTSTASRTLTATITDPSGIAGGAAAPRIYYRKGTSGAYTSALATGVSGSSYTFTIDYAALGGVVAGDVIQYYVAAQDVPGNVSTSPGGGSGANPPGTTAPASPNAYQIQFTLSGTYYVGTSTSPDPTRTYASLTAAVASYNQSALGGAVTFLLLDPTYSTATGETFPLVLNANADASATNTLTIKPNAGVAAVVSGSVATGAVLKLNGADYVTVDGANNGGTTQNLIIENTATTGTGNAVLWIAAASATDGANSNTVRNSILRGSSATGSPQFVVFLGGGGVGVAAPTTSTPAPNSNNSLVNNQLQKGYYGLFIFGVSATNLDQSNVISGNQLGAGTGNGFGQEGIRAVYQQNLLLEGNEIQNIANSTTTSNLYGIFLADSRSATLSRNSVHNIAYGGTSTTKAWGVFTSNTAFNTATTPSATTLVNNLVYNINSTATSATWNTVGIDNGGGYGDRYYFNTVYLSGQLSAASGTAGSAAFANGNPSITTFATNIDVRNNIFSIIGGTGGTTSTPLYAHYTQATTYASSTLNNNDLFVSTGATGLAVIGRLNAVDSPTLAAWRTATGQEANSLSVNPGFAQTTTVPYNLTPTVFDLNGAGVTIAGITTDYPGATRTSPPDVGAYEFAPPAIDLAPLALVTPAATTTCYGPAEAVTVSIRNTGGNTLDFSQNPATVTVVVTPPAGGTAQTLTATVGTGTLAPGAAQNVVLTGTVNMATTGSYSFAITATVQGDANSANDVLTPAVTRNVLNTSPSQTIVAPATACAASPFTIDVTASNAVGSVSGTAAPNAAIPDNVLTGVSSTITLAGAPATATISAASSLRVTLNITHTFDADVDIYLVGPGNAGTIELSTDNGSSGANYTNTVLSTSATGSVTAGTAPFTGVYAPEGAIGTAPGLASGTGSGTYTLPAAALNGAAINGDWKLYVFDDASGDTGTLLNWSLTVADPSIPATTVTGPGTVSAPVVNGNTSTFTVTAAPVGANSYTVTTLSANGCSATATQAVNVLAQPTASLAAATAQICAGTSYQLAGTVGGSATGGTYTTSGSGTFSPDANTLNATYAPSAADLSAGSVVLTLTTTGPAACTAATATTTLTINPATTATFAYGASAYCQGGTNPTPTITGTAGGTFSSTAGLSLDATTGVINLATSTAGTYVVTYSVGGSCPSSATASVTVNPATSAAFAYAGGTFCLSGTNPAPTITGTAGGTFSSTAGLSLNATTGVINLAASAPGTYTVTYSVGGSCPSAATAQVTITTAPSASFSYAQASYCAGATGTATPTFGTNSSGGAFTVSPATGLSLNPNTGVITLATSSAGTYTVTNTIAASGGCAAASATTTVTINAAPVATLTAGGPTTFCQGGSVTLTASAGASYQFLLNGSPISGATSATYTASAAGSYAVTVTNASGCSATSAATTVVVNPATTATFSYPAANFCLSGTNPAPTITGTAGGTFSSTTGLSLDATTGVINLAASTAGTYVVTYSVGGSCPSTGTASVTLNPVAVANAGVNRSVCSGTATTLGTTAVTGYTYSWSPATGLSSTTVSNPTLTLTNTGTTPQVVTYTLTATTANGCSSTATVQVTVNPTPGAVALTTSGPTTFCQGGSVTLTATATTGNTYQYFLGGSVISGATNPTYTVTTSGSYTVTLTNSSGCFTVSAPVVVTVNPTPAAPTLTSTIQPNGAVLLTSSAATGNQFYRNNVLVPGATGQTLLLLSGAQNGTYTVVSTSTSGCASAPSNSLAIIVTASAKANLAGLSALLYPNPSADGNVTLELRGYTKATSVTVYNTLGQVVSTLALHPEKTTVGGVSATPVDFSQLPVGVYTLRLSSPDTDTQTLKLIRR